MQDTRKADRIDLFRFSTPQMCAFHITWLAFFCCFFAWFWHLALDAGHPQGVPVDSRPGGLVYHRLDGLDDLCPLVFRLAQRSNRPAAGVHVALDGWIAGGAGRGLVARLHELPDIPAAHRRHWGLVCGYPVSHERDVRSQLRRHRQRRNCRLGQSRRRATTCSCRRFSPCSSALALSEQIGCAWRWRWPQVSAS